MTVMRIFSALWVFSILATVYSQQNILNTTVIKDGNTLVIKDGQPFSMTCNIGTVGVSASNVKLVSRLAILRQLPGDSQYTQLAHYLSYGPPEGKQTQTVPAGRQWNVTFTGAGDGSTSNPNMMISISVPDTRCSDAGMYKCEMEYFNIQNQLVSGTQNTQNVSSEAGVKNIVFSWSPDNSLPSSPYYSEFYENDNITITCRVDGPRDLTLGWRVGRVPSFGGDRIFTDYMFENDHTTQAPTLVPGNTCESYRHVSTLKMTINNFDHNDVMYLCEVREKGMVLMSSNLTTGLIGNTGAAGSGDNEPNKGGLEGGAIAGIVIGCLVLIIIVVVVVVVLLRRKKKGDKYEDDRPDANTESNLHAPPPVFYSKPNKPPPEEKINTISSGVTNEGLDTSYDSRDSAHKPPRYANTAPDSNGPPRYEKESNKGRSNRGYDDEDRDRNGGHGRRHERRSRTRDPDDNEPRGRSYDNEPRGRSYSNEDGTDDRGYGGGFGDPSIGTAI